MNQREIKELIELFDESDVKRLKIRKKDFFISLSKEGESLSMPTSSQVSPPTQTTQVVENTPVQVNEPKPSNKNTLTINSPMVGTFYKAPSPGAAPFVKVGDRVSKGQTVGIIEAMKIMNEIEAEFDCKIIEVLVEDGQPVEFDTPLFVVEKL